MYIYIHSYMYESSFIIDYLVSKCMKNIILTQLSFNVNLLLMYRLFILCL